MRKIFLFFLTVFFLSFLILNTWQFFDFVSRQAQALAQTQVTTPLPTTPTAEVSLSSSPPSLPRFVAIDKADSLEIPSLNVEAPLIFGRSQDPQELYQDLNKGVVVFPDGSRVGQDGHLVILGHSAPFWWPKIRYEGVFSRLNDLQTGDVVLVNFENRQYTFRVTQKIFLDRGQALPVAGETGQGQFLYLLTCWPPGRDLRRLAVEAVLEE